MGSEMCIRDRGIFILSITLGTRMDQPQDGHRKTAVVVVVVVFTLNRSFYLTTSAVHPVSVLILHPTEIQVLWSHAVKTEKNQTK